MTIERIDDGKKGFFKAVVDGKESGLMTYVWSGPGKFIIDHTEVHEAFAGQGVGKQLALEAVKYARENNLKILPLCPYAKSVFDKNADLHDVLF